MDEMERVWLVERTYSDDEQNLIILTYATMDGRYEFRKERAVTSFSGSERETSASLLVEQDNLALVDEKTRKQYADEVTRMKEKHDPDDAI
ncbi:hypothetical protein [Halocatena marina]|uniref:DUF7967 domain-containing protein n=2 Tax=Halocatena marina TaxID=2934937 RepID=A0ABD5YT67_9EURY|nr:hypothetical protein [Halocatena marina]